MNKSPYYAVFPTEKSKHPILHKIVREPQFTLFPALFESYSEAIDYARNVGVIRKVWLSVNKKVLYKGVER